MKKILTILLVVAVTIASAQGRTIFGEIGVGDTNHTRFALRHLYTCLSRAQKYTDPSIED